AYYQACRHADTKRVRDAPLRASWAMTAPMGISGGWHPPPVLQREDEKTPGMGVRAGAQVAASRRWRWSPATRAAAGAAARSTEEVVATSFKYTFLSKWTALIFTEQDFCQAGVRSDRPSGE